MRYLSLVLGHGTREINRLQKVKGLRMKLITRYERAKTAAKRWREQYPRDHHGIGAKLEDLGAFPSPHDVDRVIGNKSWTRVTDCSECGALEPDMVMEIGESPDIESSTAWICYKCLNQAHGVMSEFLPYLSGGAT